MPAIFQYISDEMLDGLSQTGGILDNLIVTGVNDEQHLLELTSDTRSLKTVELTSITSNEKKITYMYIRAANCKASPLSAIDQKLLQFW